MTPHSLAAVDYILHQCNQWTGLGFSTFFASDSLPAKLIAFDHLMMPIPLKMTWLQCARVVIPYLCCCKGMPECFHVISDSLFSQRWPESSRRNCTSLTYRKNCFNAGVMAAPEGMKTDDGFDVQFGTNHLGHFLLFELFKPALLAATTPQFQSRVVSLSSSGQPRTTISSTPLVLHYKHGLCHWVTTFLRLHLLGRSLHRKKYLSLCVQSRMFLEWNRWEMNIV